MHRISGFTLIEVIIVLALIGVFAAFGIVAGIDTYKWHLFRREVRTIVTLIQRARLAAMYNMGGLAQGIYFGNPDTYITFRGTSWTSRNPVYDRYGEKIKSISLSGLTELIFAPLSGTTVGGTITLSDGLKTAAITINNEGGITW